MRKVPSEHDRKLVQARESLRALLLQYDVAEFQAQTHAVEMVNIVASFARDEKLDVKFRKECALDVVDRAYGKVTTKVQTTQLFGTAPDPVAATIQAAASEADKYLRLSEWIGSDKPVSQWPDDVQATAREAGIVADVEHEGPAQEVLDSDAPLAAD